MARKIIDMSQSPRAGQFAYFSAMADPWAGATVMVDITDFLPAIREKSLPFFLSFLFAVTRAGNAVPELRRRLLPDGTVDLADLKKRLRPDTVLVAVTAVDSELGVVQPIAEIAELLKAYPNCHFHVDATQAVGKIPVQFEGTDTMSLTAHKLYGLNGIGILVKRLGLALPPLIHGGESTTPYRSGTPTVALACSLALALEKAAAELPARATTVRSLNDRLRAELTRYPKVRINSPANAVPHILNLSVQGVKGTVFQRELDVCGVCVSVKSACSSDGLPSRAVLAVSQDRRNALSSWRISLSHLTTEEEVTFFLQAFADCYNTLTR